MTFNLWPFYNNDPVHKGAECLAAGRLVPKGLTRMNGTTRTAATG